jgi:predicted amidohydrolase
MRSFRIALANLVFPRSPEDALERVVQAVAHAGRANAKIVCFPECYLPGYRGYPRPIEVVDAAWLARAWARVGAAAKAAEVAVVLGTERFVEGDLVATALVIDAAGNRLGFQDKVQLDPSEDAIYTPGNTRQVFEIDGLRFGVVICHEGFRYPETVRWAARRGAQIVFHPHVHERADDTENEEGAAGPDQRGYAEPSGSFHEKAALCRAAENTIFYATVNCALAGSATASAVVDPDGRVVAFQPYGVEGLLVADLDLDRATGLLAGRLRPS